MLLNETIYFDRMNDSTFDITILNSRYISLLYTTCLTWSTIQDMYVHPLVCGSENV